jgi:hypothetical protein
MLIGGLVAMFFILGLFFSMLGSGPNPDRWGDESTRTK